MEDKLNKKEWSKEEVLSYIQNNKESFSKEEVLNSLEEKDKNKKGKVVSKVKNKILPTVAYMIGALVVVTGATLLILDSWSSMGTALRIAATFGLGLLAYLSVLGLEFFTNTLKALKYALTLISAFLIIFGGGIIASEVYSLDFIPEVQLLTFSFLALLFGVLFYVKRRALYITLLIASLTWSLYCFVAFDFFESYIENIFIKSDAAFIYLTALIGLIYLSLNKFFLTRYEIIKKRLSSLLYFLGSLGVAISPVMLALLYESSEWLVGASVVSLILIWIGFKSRLKEFSLSSTLALIFVMFTILGGFLFGLLSLPFVILIIPTIISSFRDQDLLPHAAASIFGGTVFIASVMDLLGSPEAVNWVMTSLVGAGYIYIAYLFSERLNLLNGFSNRLYSLGVLGFIIPLFRLTYIHSGGIWDFIAIIAILMVIALGTYLAKKVILIPGALLLPVHIIIVSERYFIDNMGWPITLIVAGLAIMGVGYLSYRLTEKISDNREVE